MAIPWRPGAVQVVGQTTQVSLYPRNIKTAEIAKIVINKPAAGWQYTSSCNSAKHKIRYAHTRGTSTKILLTCTYHL